MKKIALIIAFSPLLALAQNPPPKMFRIFELAVMQSTSKADPGNDNVLIEIGDSVQLIAPYDEDTWKARYKNNIGYIQQIYVIKNDGYASYKALFKKTISASEDEKRKTYLIKRYGTLNAKNILIGSVRLGWTKQMVIEAIGQPDKINRTVGKFGIHEQWVYKNEYYYFEDGILTTWQD